ncbi:MAG: sulfatase [Acidobacteriota bacterium]|nr:sulfatase [Acidobacteriota bacterium]
MRLTRRQFVLTGTAAAFAQAPPPEAPHRQPNVLFLLADQWRAQAMPGAAPGLHAPNLGRLATEGLQFNRCYATYPLCAPSRASLLTGRYPHACGVINDSSPLPPDQPSLARELKSAGYRTGYIGEWHLDGAPTPGFVPPGPRRHGFDYWAAFNRGNRYYDSLYFRDRPEAVRVSGFEPDDQTALAIEFLKQNRALPFFLYVSWGPPHPPRAVKLENLEVRLRANVPEELEERAREGYAGYYALCSAIDVNIGRLLVALDERGLARDTIVVFTSDHGDMLTSHGLEDKNVPYEESARVPLVLRYPARIAAGGVDHRVSSNVELMPRILTLCGLEVENGGGRTESIYAQGKLGEKDEWRMLVRGLDKLVIDREFKVTAQYNLGADPYELENLAGEAARELRRDELMALLKDAMRRAGDKMDTSGLKRR